MAAASLFCLVIAVADGDTLTVRCGQEPEAANIIVRLSQIDAPERRQPWGNRSRQHLAALCLRKPATVQPEGHDKYRRTVGRVTCDGVDTNLEQVRAGMAWVFDRYVTDRSLYPVQDAARAERAGLWQDDSPVAPWEWRASGSPARRTVD